MLIRNDFCTEEEKCDRIISYGRLCFTKSQLTYPVTRLDDTHLPFQK
jgi:hypothetical protein